MDISEKLKQMAKNNVENEKRAKMITELLNKKYDLQKSLKDAESAIDLKQCELVTVKKQVISLSCEMPVGEAKTEVSRRSLENLVKQVVEQDDKISEMQKDLWTNINDWVSSSSESFRKNILFQDQNKECAQVEEKVKEKRMEQIKLEGQLQAVGAYEQYQLRKIGEIQRIKDIVDNVDNLPKFM